MEQDENGYSDGDEDYDTLYRNSQAAISQSKSNQCESRALQDELLDYVDDLDHKKGSDGKALIKVPSNFNSIVESMNREDIATTKSDEKPWSQYLLLDSLNSEFDAEYNGRYSQAFEDTPDIKIERGLAQIQLLDRQLQEAARKSKYVNVGQGSPRQDDDMDDPTFVTAGKRRAGADTTEPSHRIDSARRSSEKLRPKFASKSGNKPKESADGARQKQRLELLTSDLGEDVDLQERLGAFLDPQLEQQCRDIDAQLMQFGRLDLLQAEGDRTEKEFEEGEQAGCSEGSRGAPSEQQQQQKSSRPDYLAEQRRDRAERDRAQRIDSLLEAVTSQPIKYEALVHDGDANMEGPLSVRTGSAMRSAQSPVLRGPARSTAGTFAGTPGGTPGGTVADPLEVPSPSAVNPEKIVTADDIQELLRVLSASQPHSQCTWQSQSSAVQGDSPSQAREGFSPSPGSSHSSGPGGGGLQLRPVDKDAVRALVQQYKRDVEALGRVRRCSQMRRITSAMAGTPLGASAGSGADAELTGFSRPGSVQENASPRRRGAGSNASSQEELSLGADSIALNRDRWDTEGGSRSAGPGSRLLDLSEVAPQSVINMAHPALAGGKQLGQGQVQLQRKVGTASAGAGFEGALPVPAPPLGTGAGSLHLPLSPDPRFRSGGESSAGRRSLAWTAALGGSEDGEEAHDDSSARSRSAQRRTPKSLRLAPHSPSSPGPTPARALGGSDVLMARSRGFAGSSSSTAAAPQSVFRAFHSGGLGDSLLAGLSRLGRPSPRSAQRPSQSAASDGGSIPSIGGNAYSAVQQQRRAMKASNVLSSMTSTKPVGSSMFI